MDILNSDTYKLLRYFQKIIGFWQFQSFRRNLISWIYVYFFTSSLMIAMGIRLYNEIGVNTDIVIENITGEMYLSNVLFKLTSNIVHSKELKYLYIQIAKDWKIITDAEEQKVMLKYTEEGRRSITLYAGYMITGVSAFLIMPVAIPLLDYIIPLENGTRPKVLPYYAEYGVDQEEYFYPLIIQGVFGGMGTIMVLVTFDLGFIMIVQHTVALFALVNFRLQKVEDISKAMERGILNYATGDSSAYKYVTSAVRLHHKAIEYVDYIENSYTILWLIVLFLNMIMVGGSCAIVINCLNILTQNGMEKKLNYLCDYSNVLIMVVKLDRPEEFIRYTIIVIAILVHFYYLFLPGQKIINSSTSVFDACYACKWYNLSKKTKNLLKIMTARSLRRCELTGGKMFILSMETYCSMMKTGLSVFTVINANE